MGLAEFLKYVNTRQDCIYTTKFRKRKDKIIKNLSLCVPKVWWKKGHLHTKT